MDNLQDMQNENVHDKLWHDYHRCERHVVLQVIFTDLVVLSNLGFVAEEHDDPQSERYHEESLGLASIGHH